MMTRVVTIALLFALCGCAAVANMPDDMMSGPIKKPRQQTTCTSQPGPGGTVTTVCD